MHGGGKYASMGGRGKYASMGGKYACMGGVSMQAWGGEG